MAPWVFRGPPDGLRVLSSSDLAVATVVAMGLNILLAPRPAAR